MCLIIFAHQYWPGYPLVVTANRDEFYARPSAAAQYWADHSQVLAGRDLEQGGTWLGTTRSGRFAAVTNVRDPDGPGTNARSRGDLTREFLCTDTPPEDYLAKLAPQAQDYGAFNLLLGTPGQLWYFSNRVAADPRPLAPGLYGLSNAALDTPWPKVEHGKQRLYALLNSQPAPDCEQLTDVVADRALAAPEALSEQCQVGDMEHLLSAQFIHAGPYGTRACTALWRDAKGNGQWRETRFDERGETTGYSVEAITAPAGDG